LKLKRQSLRPIVNDAQTQESEVERLAAEPRQVRWIWAIYLLLLAVAIPWYWPPGFRGPLIVGFPLWALVTVASVFLAAIWTAFVIGRYWRGGQ
jgi:hypothetical protein